MIPKRHPTHASRSAPPPSATPPDGLRSTPGPRPATYEIIERITSLQLKMAPLELLADGVVGPLLDAFTAPAGGLLLYHSEDSSLRLIASRGLSSQGREHLAQLRAGASAGWEIPLHGLMNRKAYIIERPHEHPFVPELVERDEARPLANLACIPLYRGQLPVGVILVIADRRPVTNTDVMTQVLVYDVLALALDAGLRARGEVPAPFPEDGLAALSCEEWADPRDTARTLEHQLALVTSERIELSERVGVLEAAHAEARGLLAAQKTLHRDLLETERVEAARRIAELEQRAADEAARSREAAERTRAHERAMLDEQLALERSAAATTIRELDTTLADREAAFATALQKLQTALQERDGVLAERERQLDDLGAERERLRHAASEAGDAVRCLHAEIERLKEAQAEAEADRQRAFAETQTAFEHQLAEVTVEHRRMLERAETLHGAAVGEARALEHQASELTAELAAIRDEAAGLRAERSQVLAALDAPGVEPATAVRALRDQLAALEVEGSESRAAHAELERRLASEMEAAETRLSDQRRQFHEVHAAHEREIDDLTTAHRNALEEVRAASRRELEQAEAAQRAQLADIQAEAQHKIEQERFDAQQRLDTLRIEMRESLDAAREALSEALARATSAEGRVEALLAELAAVREEVARLSEERANVLAAVDDPDAEPATVIRALRDQVAVLEGQMGMLAAERSTLERQSAAALQAAEARLAETHAMAESRIVEARATAQTSFDDARRAAEATLAELRAALAERDALLATRDEALSELGSERDQARRAAVETSDALRRSQSEVERVRVDLGNSTAAVRDARAHAAEHATRLFELERELGAARTELGRLHEERARVLAAVDDAGTEPVAVIRALREQAAALEVQVRALAEERAVAAERAVAERAALEARLIAVENERGAAETQRGEQVSRVAALERDLMRSEEMLSSARRQLEAAVERARVQASEAAAERARAQASEAAAEQARALAAEASAAWARAQADIERAPSVTAPVPPVVCPEAIATALPSRPSNASPVEMAPSLPRVEVLSPPPAPIVESGGHRILEADALVRERVVAALAAELPSDATGTLFVANLLSALPDRLGELHAPEGAEASLVTYAATAGRSRILGPVSCSAALPNPGDVLAAVASLGGKRRLISLSEDVDGLLPLKTALGKGGHSISMACDPKQALDLLGMLTPDAVLVDLCSAPEAAATFLDALALENGRTLVFLVCGDDPDVTLRRALEPLLRESPLDGAQLAKLCRNILMPPAPEAAPRNPHGRVVRPLDRKTAAVAATRKPVPRRVLTKRR